MRFLLKANALLVLPLGIRDKARREYGCFLPEHQIVCLISGQILHASFDNLDIRPQERMAKFVLDQPEVHFFQRDARRPRLGRRKMRISAFLNLLGALRNNQNLQEFILNRSFIHGPFLFQIRTAATASYLL